jgi:hypothetical protein
MATRTRQPYEPALLQLPALATTKEGQFTPNAIVQLLGFLRSLTSRFNGLVSLGGADAQWAGNLDMVRIQVVTPGVADTEFEVWHGLGRVPAGRFVVLQDIAGSVYDSNLGGWGPERLWLKCDAASVTLTLMVF